MILAMRGLTISAVCLFALPLAAQSGTFGATGLPSRKSIIILQGDFDVPVGTAIGNIVYSTGADSADQADASTITKMPALGVIIDKPSTTTAIVQYTGQVDTFVGLTPGATYYADPASPGGITSTPPAVMGQVIQKIGVAKNSTTLILEIDLTLTEL